MIRVILSFLKIVIAIICAVSLNSCNYDINIGDFETVNPVGKITTNNIKITDKFENIKVSRGIDIILTQDQTTKIDVETEENLHEYFNIYVDNNTLHIKKIKNFSSGATQNVYINMPEIKKLNASSGSTITGKNQILSNVLYLNASSAARINLKIVSENTNSEASSGSEIILSGKVIEFKAKSSSGANIKAENLITKNAEVKASSGASIKVNPLENLDAIASSGANIYYTNDNITLSKKISSGGNVTFN